MCTHSVHFYDDVYPAEAASDFVAAGVRAGDTCVVMLTQPARAEVERCLKARGISASLDSAQGQPWITMDTHDALSELVIDGRLDRGRTAEVLGQLLGQGSGGRRVRLVADLAPVLFASGYEEDAMALEALVDELALVHSASVFCAYAMHGLFRLGTANALVRVSAEHSAVAFPDRLWIRALLAPEPSPRYFGQGRSRTG